MQNLREPATSEAPLGYSVLQIRCLCPSDCITYSLAHIISSRFADLHYDHSACLHSLFIWSRLKLLSKLHLPWRIEFSFELFNHGTVQWERITDWWKRGTVLLAAAYISLYNTYNTAILFYRHPTLPMHPVVLTWLLLIEYGYGYLIKASKSWTTIMKCVWINSFFPLRTYNISGWLSSVFEILRDGDIQVFSLLSLSRTTLSYFKANSKMGV